VIIGRIGKRTIFYSIISQIFVILDNQEESKVEELIQDLRNCNCIFFEREKTIEDSFLLSEIFDFEKRRKVICADEVRVSQLKQFEQNHDEQGYIDAEPLLKIYNFYSCCYLLNYLSQEVTDSDYYNKTHVYLFTDLGFVSKDVKIFFSIKKFESLKNKSYHYINEKCFKVVFVTNDHPWIMFTGEEFDSHQRKMLILSLTQDYLTD